MNTHWKLNKLSPYCQNVIWQDELYQLVSSGYVWQPFINVIELRDSQKFHKLHRKMPVVRSLFYHFLNKEPLQLGKELDSKCLLLIFASSKAFQQQKFSCLFLLAARVHDWIILHSYVENHIFGKKTFYWPNCI